MECRLKVVICFEELFQSRENHSITESRFHFFKQLTRTHLFEAAQVISNMHYITLVLL